MIRDPSDGSVREHQPKSLEKKANGEEKPVLSTGISGLRETSTKPENLARLERSRQWLKAYYARKSNP